MATLASSALTLSEWATRLDPGGKPAAVIELLGQTNEMLTDMLWMQCNDGAGHKTTVRTGLPTATWRLLNYGVVKSKSTTAQVRDSTGMLEAYSDIDKALADLNGNTAEFRMGEDMAFIESINQGMQGTVVYGSTSATPSASPGWHRASTRSTRRAAATSSMPAAAPTPTPRSGWSAGGRTPATACSPRDRRPASRCAISASSRWPTRTATGIRATAPTTSGTAA